MLRHGSGGDVSPVQEILDRPEIGELIGRHPDRLRAELKRIAETALDEAERGAARELLASTRLFLKPIRNAPSMTTINGVGTALYGRHDPHPDGTYIATLYFVILFVPVFPLASYLVRDAGGRGFLEARAWNFLARAPIPPAQGLWRMFGCLAALGLAGFLAFAIATTSGKRNPRPNETASGGNLTIVSGLPVPVRVTMGENSVTIAPEGRGKLHYTEQGEVHIVTRLAPEGSSDSGDATATSNEGDGPIIEEFDSRIDRTHCVYNVLGTAPLYLEYVEYTASPTNTNSGRAPDILAGIPQSGQTLHQPRSVDYFFRKPPTRGSLGTRRYVDVVKDEPGRALFNTLSLLENSGRHAECLPFIQHLFERVGHLEGVQSMCLAYLAVWGSPLDMHTAAGSLLAHSPDDMNIHRMYQSTGLSVGRRDDLRTFYEQKKQAEPDNPMWHYLRARLEPERDARPMVLASLEQFPDSAWLLRSAAWISGVLGDMKAAADYYQKLRPLDREMANEQLPFEIDALAASGRAQEALDLCIARLTELVAEKSGDAELAIMAWLLITREGAKLPDGAADPEALLYEATAEQARDGEPVRDRLVYRLVTADQPLNLIAELKIEADAADWLWLRFMQALLRDPGEALSAFVPRLEPFHARAMRHEELLVALACEAVARGQKDAAAQLVGLLEGQYGEDEIAALREFVLNGNELPALGNLAPSVAAAIEFGRGRQATDFDVAKTHYARAAKRSPTSLMRLVLERW